MKTTSIERVISMEYEVCTTTNNDEENSCEFYEIDEAMEYVNSLNKNDFCNIIINIYVVNESEDDKRIYMDCMIIR